MSGNMHVQKSARHRLAGHRSVKNGRLRHFSLQSGKSIYLAKALDIFLHEIRSRTEDGSTVGVDEAANFDGILSSFKDKLSSMLVLKF